MIKVNFNYPAYSPKPTKNGLMFKLMDYDKGKNLKKYITVFCNQQIQLEDKQKIKIVAIESVSVGEYNGKDQTTINATIELSDNVDDIKKEFGITKENEIPLDDDLPF